MTLSKLSLRNAKRQARDYLVYFVTIVIAAALIYAFNSIVFSGEIRALSTLLRSLPIILVLASIVVVCIIGWLVSYTTTFMLKKRSRELGTYILIGLENTQVARLFFLENLAVGAIALALGILIGNLVYQALRAVTLSLFHVTYTFSFSFSLESILLSLLYFALIYLFALFKSRRNIRKMKICDLLYYDRQNEGEAIHKEHIRRRIFTVSIVCGVLGTLCLMMRNGPMGLLGAALIIVFLYGFFLSFSSGVPQYFDRNPAKKYSGSTLLIFRTLSSKLGTMGVVMATIALLFTGTLIAEGSGIVFNTMFQSRTEQTTCFDLFIGSTDPYEDRFDRYLSYIDTDISVRESKMYEVYQADHADFTEYVEANVKNYHREFDIDVLMRQSDYTALRAMLGYPAAEPEPGRYIVHCMPYLKELFQSSGKTLEFGGHALEPGGVYTESFTQSLWDGNGRGFILVVPDELLKDRPVSHWIYAAMTDSPVIRELYEEIRLLRDDKDTSIHNYDTIFTKAVVEEENASSYAMVVFPLYYLALVLTMVAATILTIQQLSETAHYRRQFQLLNDLGMDRREMKRALRNQFACFYAMPAVPPILIAVPFISGLANALDAGIMKGPGQIMATTALSLGLFLSIYLIYILAAYNGLKRNVLPAEEV